MINIDWKAYCCAFIHVYVQCKYYVFLLCISKTPEILGQKKICSINEADYKVDHCTLYEYIYISNWFYSSMTSWKQFDNLLFCKKSFYSFLFTIYLYKRTKDLWWQIKHGRLFINYLIHNTDYLDEFNLIEIKNEKIC